MTEDNYKVDKSVQYVLSICTMRIRIVTLQTAHTPFA